MATTPPKLLRALVDFYQGGAKVYAAGNVYPESDTLLLMKSRGDAEVLKQAAESKAAKAAREAAEKAEREAQEAAEKAAREQAEREAEEAAAQALAEQGALDAGPGPADTPSA